MGLRMASFVIWALVAGSAAYWVFRLGVAGTAAPPGAAALPAQAALRGDAKRVLGAPPAVAPSAAPTAPAAIPASSRLRLVGLVAPQPGAVRGTDAAPAVAVISVDGAPPRAFRVGARVDEGLWLLRVRSSGVRVGPRGGTDDGAFELPAPERPVTAASAAVPGQGPAPVPGTPLTPTTAPTTAPTTVPLPAVRPAPVPSPMPDAAAGSRAAAEASDASGKSSTGDAPDRSLRRPSPLTR